MPNVFEIIRIVFAPRDNRQKDVCNAEGKGGDVQVLDGFK